MDISTTVTALAGIATTIVGYFLGQKERRSKIASDDMQTVQAAQQMIAPLLQSADDLSTKIAMLRAENQTMSQRIGELEGLISDFKTKAEKCTCGVFLPTNQAK